MRSLLTILPGASTSRVYVCDPAGHFVHVLDHAAAPLFSFGGFGDRPGQFNGPSDVTVVSTSGSTTGAGNELALIAVADRGNHRVQLFDPEGVLVAVLAAEAECEGWPRFSTAQWLRVPCLVEPSALEWRAPFLEVTTANERAVRVEIGAELLQAVERPAVGDVNDVWWPVEANQHPLTAYLASYATLKDMAVNGRFWTRQ
jgi:hypothetical protein